jgi:phage-related protein
MTDSSVVRWRVVYYRDRNNRYPIQEFIKGLSQTARAAVIRDIDLLAELGLALGAPTVKPIKGVRKLWELRTKTADGAIRIFYVAVTGKRFVLLHGFIKKTEKTPKIELDVAAKRLQEILEQEV